LEPGTPGEVIASAERIRSSVSSGSSRRSRTSAAIDWPLFTAALAMSAVAA
jgi:hypothetical protein